MPNMWPAVLQYLKKHLWFFRRFKNLQPTFKTVAENLSFTVIKLML